MRFPRNWIRFLSRASVALSLTQCAFAITDLDGDGYDDVWEQRFDVTMAAFPPSGDFDGDGFTNLQEMLAGTDPRDANDNPRVNAVTVASASAGIKVPTKVGTKYQLQSGPGPAGPWQDEGAPKTGDGTTMTLSYPVATPPGTRFFNVKTTDQDSDGDGISDWAENLLGTNPLSGTSATNASGGIASDLDTLKSLMTVTVAPVTADAFAKEAVPAQVRFSRTYGIMPLKVPFNLGGATDPTKGSAAPADYTLTNGSGNTANFAAGATTADVTINPVVGAALQVPRSLRFIAKPLGLPPVAAAPTAEVKIKDAMPVTANRKLYVAYLGREAGVSTTATGVATALIEGDNTSASISLTFSNLSSVQNNAYLVIGAGLQVFNIGNGQVSGLSFPITARQTVLTDQAMLTALIDGSLYVSVSSANNPNGEIRGSFQPASGSVAPPPTPADPPAYGSAGYPNLAAGGVTNNPLLDRDIARFLTQATFGPTPESIQEIRDLITANANDAIAGYTAWLNKQLDPAQTPSPSLLNLTLAADLEEFVLRGNKPITYPLDPQFGASPTQFNAGTDDFSAVSTINTSNYPSEQNRRREWWTIMLGANAQLRQRMALALSEIVVISETDSNLTTYHYGMANYWDMLANNAFGPYRTILNRVTYSPQMGVYLTHIKNQKRFTSGSTIVSPDENYAREITQLFSIGLVLRHPDGSLKLDATNGLPIATYDQEDITEMARVMTGMSFSKYNPTVNGTAGGNQAVGPAAVNTNFGAGYGHRFWQASWTNDMRLFSAFHDFNDYATYPTPNRSLPAGQTTACSKVLFEGKVGQKIIPIRTVTDANADLDVQDAIDALATHPNTSVFVSRLLIQRFTSSNPSAAYLYRVSQKYRDTMGSANQLGEVLKAILLDYEVRNVSLAEGTATFGKPKEPLIHFAAFLRGLKFTTGAPLANLGSETTNYVTTGTATEAPGNLPYTDVSRFASGAKRFRFPDTEAGTIAIGQSPQSPPSVFNWFLPEFVVPGPLGNAGLFAPELQIASESNVVRLTNSFYNVCFATPLPPTALGTNTNGYGFTGVDGFFNLSFYGAAGTQLSVPPLGQPYNAATNPTGMGYFSADKFPATAASQDVINNQLDNIQLPWSDMTTPGLLGKLYLDSYNASLTAQGYSGTGNPTATQIGLAHDAAIVAVLDQCDLILCAGFLKAKYGGLAAGTPSPRQYFIDAFAPNSGIGNRTYHTTQASNGFWTNMQTRVKALVFLVATSPQALVLK